MRPTRPVRPRIAPALLAALLAACDGGGADPIAAPHQLRLDIVRGKGIIDTVRRQDAPADARTALPVVVRVYAELERSAQVLPGATGPALDVRIPPVEIVWRTLEPWCQPESGRTAIAAGDTAVMRLRLPTVANKCRLVADGVVNGTVFGTDTAVVDFKPGPAVRYELQSLVVLLPRVDTDVRGIPHDARDAYGNAVDDPGFAWAVTAGAPNFSLKDYVLRGEAEGVGALQATGAGSTQTATLWSLRNAVGAWRLTWRCYGARLADGTYADSAHYALYPADSYYGSFSPRGIALGFRGTLNVRTWVRGGPARDEQTLAATRYAAQRPGVLEWSPGQVATATGLDYAGGSLCDPAAGGGPWTGFGPARAEQQP